MRIMTDRDDFIQKLIDALGLPQHIIAFTIKARVEHAVIVETESYAETPEKEILFKKYHLYEIENEQKEKV